MLSPACRRGTTRVASCRSLGSWSFRATDMRRSADLLSAWFPDLPDAAAEAIFLDGPRLHLSASTLRARAAAGRSLRYLVPDAVCAHIEDHALYRA